MAEPLLIAKNGTTDVVLFPALANRHGLITGATGTGKTVTLQRLAEGFSTLGVPVFLADVKGDLAGIAAAGTLSPKLSERLKVLQIEHFEPRACPAALWDVFGELGHPVRATISDMGPLLLTRLLNLNETQAGVLQLAFKVADDNGLLLLDLKDLRAMLKYVADHAADLKEYGNVSTASVGAIQRGLLAVEQEGAERFFGEPMLDIADLMQTDADGHGVVNILAAEKLYGSPKLYAAFLLWLLSELFEHLPEVGDLAVPKLVFFFDEAHLLFESAPEALLTKIEQVVRLIRSKGVGIYFVTQSPLDVPDSVLGQLGNRIQHALRAASVRDQKAVRAAADTLPQNSALDLRTAITELAVGEALISCLDEQGRPTKTERAWVVPPSSRLGPITGAERKAILDASLVAGHYEQVLDRESAYERLRDAVSAPAAAKVSATAPAQAGPPAPTGGAASDSPFGGALNGILFGTTGPRGGKHDGLAQLAAKSVVRSVGSSLGRDLVRGVLGSLMGTSRRR